MPICAHCHENVPTDDTLQAGAACPHCGGERDGERWRDAARIGNLAEAGYLVSRLAGEGIDARLVESESFNAAVGNWNNSYVLQVPAGMFASAAVLLREEAEEADLEEPAHDSQGEPFAEEPVHLVIWRPVALMALAGLATLWLGQRMADPRPRLGAPRGSEALGNALDAIGRPFVVESANGKTEHRLQYQSNERTWILESDTTGDGRLDTRKRFVMK